uniref:Uncharacterized protein n=1 Tax=Leersia perrieri TaxID=77586 RepID=A0A0D9WUD0_9ORYZ
MEPSDLNTHLPPRKRLLAGLRMAATPCGDAEPPPPAMLLTGDLAVRLRQMMLSANSSSSSPEEIVESARSAASVAAEAAAAARATAAEKAAVAAKARAAARAAMEFLDSISRPGSSRNGLQLKVKSRKKHVQVKLLYKPNGNGRLPLEGRDGATGDASSRPRRRRESDEEIARKLHRAMNSSPRISFTGPKRPRTIVGENGGVVDACNGSSAHPSPIEASAVTNGCALGQSSEIPVPFSKHEGLDDDKDSYDQAANSRGAIDGNGLGAGNLSAGRKVKIKRKELLLNKHNSKDTEESKEIEPSIDSIRYDKSKISGAEKRSSFVEVKDTPGDGLAPMKISSVWKFKKFKTSHCSSDSKVLHNVCPSTSAAETSASVKAD